MRLTSSPMDEKRRFLRAFVRKVELDPTTGTGRAEIYDLPLFGTSVQEKKDGQGDRPSSFLMVAGARYVVSVAERRFFNADERCRRCESVRAVALT